MLGRCLDSFYEKEKRTHVFSRVCRLTANLELKIYNEIFRRSALDDAEHMGRGWIGDDKPYQNRWLKTVTSHPGRRD